MGNTRKKNKSSAKKNRSANENIIFSGNLIDLVNKFPHFYFDFYTSPSNKSYLRDVTLLPKNNHKLLSSSKNNLNELTKIRFMVTSPYETKDGLFFKAGIYEFEVHKSSTTN